MTQPHQIRDQLQHALIADLLGPAGGPDEIVEERNVSKRLALTYAEASSTLFSLGQWTTRQQGTGN